MRIAPGQHRVLGPILFALVVWSPRLLEDLTGHTTARHVIASDVLQRALLIDTVIFLVLVTTVSVISGVIAPLLDIRLRRDAGTDDSHSMACAAVLSGSSAFLALHAVLASSLLEKGLWGISALAGTALIGAALGYPLALLVRLGIERIRGERSERLLYALLLLLWVATTHPLPHRLPGQILLVGSSLVAAWLMLPLSRSTEGTRRAGILGAAVVLPALVVLVAAWLGPSYAFAYRAKSWIEGISLAVEKPETSGANVLIILVDTWRVDRTNPGGYMKATTPRLAAALDERTTWFHRAHAAAPATRASVEALMTSRLPSQSERSDWAESKLRAWTMAEAFRRSGYQTASFSANSVIEPAVYRKGFETFWAASGGRFVASSFFMRHLLFADDDFETLRRLDDWRLHNLSGETVRTLGRKWLEDRDRERPFFLYLHVTEPHWPYRDYGHGLIEDAVRVEEPLSYLDLLYEVSPDREPAAAITRGLPEMLGRYDESVREADDVLGGMLEDLESLDLGDSTLVVMLGDHGDEFLEHGGFSHGHDVYQELIHVPLVIRWPRSRDFDGHPTRISEPVSLIDVFPTLEDYLPLMRGPQPHVGSSLRQLLEDTRASRGAPVIAERIGRSNWRAAHIEGDLKVRLSFDPSNSPFQVDDIQVFDLGIDAAEQMPRTASDPPVAALTERAREALYQRWLAWPNRDQDLVPSKEDQSTDGKVLEQLRALGYVE